MSPAPRRPPIDKVKSDKEFETKLTADKDAEKVKEGKEFETKLTAEKEFEKVKSDKEFETKLTAEKEFEKVKSDDEKPVEKFKRDDEKPVEKVKSDKEFEKVKSDDEKPVEKFKRDDEKPVEKVKSDKEQFEKVAPEKLEEIAARGIPGGPAGGLDPAALLAHADNLEQCGRQLRHFIERSLRPDLSTGALRNEQDLQEAPSPEQDDD